jgi:hypothetical protein
MTGAARNATACTRRALLRRAGRGAALAALAGVAAVLGVRRRRRDGETCINAGLCQRCEALSDCHLPRGASARRVLREGASWTKRSAG